MRPQQALYQLLVELFDDNSALAIFLSAEDRDPRLLHALPGQGVSRSEYAFKAVSALESRGLIDAIFFARLLRERPGRRPAIVEVARGYGVEAPAVPAGPVVAPVAPEGPRPRRVFVAYSRRDLELLRELDAHLAPLRRQRVIDPWTDREIVAGQSWDDAIKDRHARAELYLFLVSADFLATDYCYDIEVKRALERRRRGEAVAVPIILRPCDWESTPLGAIQALPDKGRPITQWEDRDVAWTAVVQGLRQVLAGL